MSGYSWLNVIRQIHKRKNIDLQSFGKLLSSEQRLKVLREKQIGTGSVWQLMRGLFGLNKTKVFFSLVLFVLRLVATISMPFFLSYVIGNLSQQDCTLSLSSLILVIFGYKILSSLIWTLCDFLYTDLGIEFFAYLQYILLGSDNLCKGQPGKAVNIIEYDCTLVSSITYSTFTTFFYCIQLTILFSMIIGYLMATEYFSTFVVLLIFYVFCQGLACFGIYLLNRNYINQKDKRLSTNMTQNSQEMLQERGKQLKANNRFLLMRMVSKLITIVFPILLNIYIFVIAQRSLISQNEYSILIIVNLIRNPIGELMLALNLNAEILNSCRRIVRLINRKGLQSQISEQLVINEEIVDISQKIESWEEGNIDLKHIFRSLFATVGRKYWIALSAMLLALLFSRYYSNYVTKMMLAQQLSLQLFLGLTSQILIPLLFYFLLIVSLQKMAGSILQELPFEMNYEVLNRISGDIAAVDRSATINTFEISFAVTAILGSYLYSIVSIQVVQFSAFMALFLLFCILVAFALNRFVMEARRQLFRGQLRQKSTILAGFLKGENIKTSQRLKNHWTSIFECKQMGILAENYFILLVSLITLILSLLFIILSVNLVEQESTRSILVMVCLSLDRDMLLLFYAMVRLQLSLVSFERVLNVIKI